MAEGQSGEEILPKVSTPEWGARTLLTTERRQADLRQQIPERSGKRQCFVQWRGA